MSQSSTQQSIESTQKVSTEEHESQKTAKGVSFGGEEVRYITPSPECNTTLDDNTGFAALGFAALGFGALGTVGEGNVFNVQELYVDSTSGNGQVAVNKTRACAPISASRLVQRRWRSSNASGRR